PAHLRDPHSFPTRRSSDLGGRLTGPADGRLELIRTQEILRSHLGTAPLDILDVGGATGIHSAWLAADGHRCTVLDPMPHHVAAADRKSTRLNSSHLVISYA